MPQVVFAFFVAIGGNIKNPDNITHTLASQKKVVLDCHDNDEAGVKSFEKLKNLYPPVGAVTDFEKGKDIGEAIANGVNIKEWLLTKIDAALNV